MLPQDVWYGEHLGARAARLGLWPASVLYAIGWQAYLAMYRVGLKRAKRVHPRVICVGNLMIGGTGKSPVTARIAQLLSQCGHRVILGCSGYGSPHAEAATMAPQGDLEAAEWGDEPAMFRAMLPDIPIVVGRRRVLAAEIAYQADPSSILLMDDGFQHLPLAKNVQIVLDPIEPKNVFCLPAGPYREPRRYRKRASIVLPNTTFKVRYSELEFSDEKDQNRQVTEADVFCAIGQPNQFVNSLEEAGIKVIDSHFRQDHDALEELPKPAGRPLIVTEKDWVKIRRHPNRDNLDIVIARRTARIEPEDAFTAWLLEQLERAQ